MIIRTWRSPLSVPTTRQRWRCGGEEDPDDGGPGSGKDVVVVAAGRGKAGFTSGEWRRHNRNTRSSTQHTHTHTHTHSHTRTEIPGSPGRITWLPTGAPLSRTVLLTTSSRSHYNRVYNTCSIFSYSHRCRLQRNRELPPPLDSIRSPVCEHVRSKIKHLIMSTI